MSFFIIGQYTWPTDYINGYLLLLSKQRTTLERKLPQNGRTWKSSSRTRTLEDVLWSPPEWVFSQNSSLEVPGVWLERDRNVLVHVLDSLTFGIGGLSSLFLLLSCNKVGGISTFRGTRDRRKQEGKLIEFREISVPETEVMRLGWSCSDN